MKPTNDIQQIDTLSEGLSDQRTARLAIVVKRGIDRFWAKRGGDPEINTWGSRRHGVKRKAAK